MTRPPRLTRPRGEVPSRVRTRSPLRQIGIALIAAAAAFGLMFVPATAAAATNAVPAGHGPATGGSLGPNAIVFAPGTYGSAANPLKITVGYYTSISGLGQNPNQVVINGTIDVYNQCFGGQTNCVALVNFWRS